MDAAIPPLPPPVPGAADIHGSLTWIVGADPVEGHTGIVLPLLIAAGLLVAVDAVAGSRGPALRDLEPAVLGPTTAIEPGGGS